MAAEKRKASIVLALLVVAAILFVSLNAVHGRRQHSTPLWTTSSTFNVANYGAVGDGSSDDSSAFWKAWNDLCQASDNPTMYIPKRKSFLVKPIKFKGPCKASNVNIQVMGNIVAPFSPKTWAGIDPSVWISFTNVNGLRIFGSGTIDGQGSGWWEQSCRYHPGRGCTSTAPTAIKFMRCTETHVQDVTIENSAQTHMLAFGCHGFYVTNVNINSPGNSPNTDGIHLQSTALVRINKSSIAAGDDCISIGDETKDVIIDSINCGPGHGISIGSLGKGGSYVQVENIHVSNVNFVGTTNGARIKTWQEGEGFAKDITFKQLNFSNVENPIVIDQYYCHVRGECPVVKTGVHISDVTYEELHGTSSTKVAIALNCSQSVPCTNIKLQSINLTPVEGGEDVTAACVNVYGKTVGEVKPSLSCLK